MSTFYNETEADHEVISSLIKEINKLRSKIMSKYIKGNDGNIYAVDEFEVITTDEINTEITDLENQLAELKALLAQDEPAASNDNVTITDTFTDTETETITITNDAPAEPVAPTEQPQPEAVAVEQPTQPEPTPEQAPVIQ